MRRFFIGLFIVSLLAAGGAYYWRTYHPESVAARAPSMETGPSMRTLGREKSSLTAEKAPSERQDWAMMISVASSIISALGAVMQVWLTHRAIPKA